MSLMRYSSVRNCSANTGANIYEIKLFFLSKKQNAILSGRENFEVKSNVKVGLKQHID